MKTLKPLLLFIPLCFFLSCQGPYDKPPKKPVKIGLADAVAAKASKEKAESESESGEKEESAVDLVDFDNKGVGPVKSVELGDEIDQDMADAGKETFNSLCVACHKLDSRFVGPALGDVLDHRSPEWVMNMILDPNKMLEEDPIAKKLLEEFGAPMADLGLSEDQARELVEYFRTLK